ncbi:MAG: PQQ-dependent sugar dehydrogenase, partial [Pyrinomonadaceae bacterium]
RQYIEHTLAGTFAGQQGGASWRFNWTAPPTDVGTITFYAAGNHANNDGNTSGDHIYRTFVASAPFSSTPDFVISANPSSRAITPGGNGQYTVTVTPLAGFTGVVTLSASGVPTGASAGFNPPTVNITDASSKISTLTITTSGSTPLADHIIGITAVSGMTMRSTSVTLSVISPSSADVALSKTASPNPGQVGVNISYRVAVTNNGPATATNVNVTDTLPSGVTFVSATPLQGSCSGTATVNCSLGSLTAGANTVVTIVVAPTAQAQIVNTASVSANEADFDTSNNLSSATVLIQAAATTPVMLDPSLGVKTVVTGLDQPISVAFLGANDFLVIEKASGKVRRIVNGVVQTTVLDLPVNSASERGLLGIALHPQFTTNGFVYLFWTESLSGTDTLSIDDITLLGNRVDRYIWNGSTLTFDRNLIRLRALQQDAGQPSRGNHDGGVLRFGPDGKLYILFGDNGRRGLLQNITSGGPVPDDQFGGPEPDDEHLTGVILRLNDDGTTPSDNPFFNANSGLTGEAAANVKKIFAYGVRNGFGMAFDPASGSLWSQENGDDAFDEMNRVVPGFNGGWIQIMGPLGRLNEFKSIESTYGNGTLQQLRWPPSNIADTPQAALARLYMLPGAQYTDPEFSWKFAVAPSTLGFVVGGGLGPQFQSDMFVGASRATLLNGFLFRFKFTSDRQHFSFSDPRLADLVADNTDKFDLAESESLALGRDFGITTDIQTGPNGNVFIVSLSNGAVYEVFSKSALFVANLDGFQETPPHATPARGTATLLLNKDQTTARVSLRFRNLSGPQTLAHIHGPALPGQSAAPIFDLPMGNFDDFQISLTPSQVSDLKAGKWYVNVHSTAFPAGEIRGQLGVVAESSIVQLDVADQNIPESSHFKTINVIRLGDSSTAVNVDYATVDGTATERADYTAARGTLRFAAGQTQKSFDVLITDDGYVEPAEGFVVTLSNPTGPVALNTPSSLALAILDNDTIVTNPIDDTQVFVRQHYHDFLDREPDTGGYTFWTNEIDLCGPDIQCREIKRINVSAAFFLSIEFQETGYLVYRMYKAAYGNISGTPVPIRLIEFLPDKQQMGQGLVVGQVGWEQVLEDKKNAFAADFVARSRFTTAFPTSMTPAQFVDTLFANAGVTPSGSEQAAAIAEFGSATTTGDAAARARAVRRVAENPTLAQQEFSRAFVLMQYFGYLRRNPNDAPDSNFNGYNFWLNKLNQFNGNFIDAEMVKAFIVSIEYRQRFGP